MQRARAAVSKLDAWNVVQAIAVVAAAGFAYNGARVLDNSPRTQDLFLANFDSAVIWLGLALVALALVAWRPARPNIAAMRQAVATIWEEHYVEVLLFAGILGLAVFMRFFRFGGALPPDIGLCCEEHINGGVAYDALQGDRPILFPLVRWTSALGFLVFDETTFGLRFFFPVMGIATLVVFYFLLRNLVSVQSALFGFALYAVAWWPSLRDRQTSAGTIYAVLFAFFIVRGFKTKNPLMFLGAGIVAGLISYEYEAFRVVPIIALGIAGLAAVRAILVGGRLQLARQRATDLARQGWRPALVFLFAAGIVLVPMIVGTQQGKDFYLTSVHRNEDTRGGSRLADAWSDQLRWASTMFLPFSSTDYPTSPPREIAGKHLLDPLTASLAALGMAAGAIFFLRGYRFWFVTWVAATLAGGALLLGEFAPWSFFGVVPILLLLAAYFVDDVETFVERFGHQAKRALMFALIGALAFSLWWNADMLFNDVAEDATVQRAYGGETSFMYVLCDYARDRGDESFTIAYSDAVTVDGFAAPRETDDEQHRAWSDFIWACHDLEGAALPAAQEAWPLRDLPAGPVTLVFADPIGSVDQLIAELNAAYPGLGEPARRIVGPGDTYDFLAYDFESGAELAREGLWGVYVKGEGNAAVATRLDLLAGLELEFPRFEPPYQVTWSGVIYVKEAGSAALRVAGELPAEVLVDGQEGVTDLLQGWHPVVVRLNVDEPGLVIALEWEDSSGSRTPVRPTDLFPLEELVGWRHTQSMGLPGDTRQFVTQRLDFSPHMSLASVLQFASPGGELDVTEERWEGVLNLEASDTLSLHGEFRAGTVTIFVDGAPIATEDRSPQITTAIETSVRLEAGRHTVEIVQVLEQHPTRSGATLTLTAADGSSPVVRPY